MYNHSIANISIATITLTEPVMVALTELKYKHIYVINLQI